MALNIVQEIRKRNREQWREYARDRWTDLRIWIQEHGEMSALISLLSGIVIVLAFKAFLVLAVVAALIAMSIWYIALPAGGAARSVQDPSQPSINGHSKPSAKRPASGGPDDEAKY